MRVVNYGMTFNPVKDEFIPLQRVLVLRARILQTMTSEQRDNYAENVVKHVTPPLLRAAADDWPLWLGGVG